MLGNVIVDLKEIFGWFKPRTKEQKIIAGIVATALAFITLLPPGYEEIYETLPYGIEGYWRDGEITQDWIFKHDRIAWVYFALEAAVIFSLWVVGHWLTQKEE